jgi:mannose-6-phosphate isomerase-like protein (cupin superfamily)
MSEISIVGPGDGEAALAGPIRLRILVDGTTTAHRLGIAEITIAPHTAGPPQHRHGRHDEGFYVVSGTARFTVGELTHDAPAGTLVMVPPGAPHTFANAGDEPAVLLNTFTPDEYVQYFRGLREMIAAGRPLTPEALATVMARYATETATTYAPAGSQRERWSAPRGLAPHARYHHLPSRARSVPLVWSSASSSAMSSPDSVKSKTWPFSWMRSRRVDFGITGTLCCRHQRSST